MKKAVLYVRVSSKEQKEEGYSIPSQKKLLRLYAKKNGIEIIKEFEEVESAKKAGRKEFDQMIKFLEAHKEIQHLLVEKTDRLTRNLRDTVKIDDLGLAIHFVKDGQVIAPDSRSGDKFMYGIKVLMAKNYIDLLSEETSKGMKEKAEQGLYPSYAPLGYVNNRETGRIDVDFIRANIIRELFEIYSKGNVSLKKLTSIAYEKELRSRKGKKIHKSAIARILRSPVYIGDMLWNGIYYKGKHDPIVSRETFERVKSILDSGQRSRGKRREFAFRGLLKCGYCGCSITAEIKKGIYIYYRCTKGRGVCPEKPIREERLAKLLGEPLKRLRITEERLEWIKTAVRESFQDEKRYKAQEISRLQSEYEELARVS